MFRFLAKKINPARKRNYFNPWSVATFLIGIAVVFPLLIIFTHLLKSGDLAWGHITTNLLPGYLANTIYLLLGVGVLVFLIGTSTAWLVSAYRFPGSRIMEWALTLPIAIPGYILGFTWVAMLDYTSPLYVYLRNNMGIETGQFLFFNILSLPGAIVILSLSLYPYVFLIAKTWFTRQSASISEAGASLGRSSFSVFSIIVLPLARPALVAGVSLALMEVLNDYGLVSYFGVDTFTTGIFTAWFAFGSPVSAVKLSGILMFFVLLLMLTERVQRGHRRYDMVSGSHKPIRKKRLSGMAGMMALIVTALPVLFGFLLPLAMLIYWNWQTAHLVVDNRFFALVQNSFLLASISAVVVVVAAILIGFTIRTFPSKFTRFLARMATLGYAIPGAVVAIGILVPFIWLDLQISTLTAGAARMLITGTWFTLIFAYMVRFMAVGFNNVESAMEKTSHSLDEASRSLGMTNMQTLRKIVLPLIRPGILSAGLLVFIDVLKELPLTLILRPFNFDTLAIRAFEFASDERVAEAAPASLIIILIGLIAVFLLNHTLKNYKL